MGYGHAVMLEEGDIFKRVFAPVSWITEQEFTKIVGIEKTFTPAKVASKPQLNVWKNPKVDAKESLVSFENQSTLASTHYSNTITIRGKQYTSIECGGGGNCFFHSISRGLQEYNIVITHIELRKILTDWLKDSENAATFNMIFGASPHDIVPYLGHLSHHCPSEEGWHVLTEGWNWQDWGSYLSLDGRWAGGLEISPMNSCFEMHGINSNVNLWKNDINLLCENTINKRTIIIMLNNNHFTYLKEI